MVSPLKKIPDSEYPEIGLLCMSYKPRETLTAIKEACSQTYPLNKITLYILYQRDSAGEYPVHYTEKDVPIKIVEIDVPGEWCAVWLFKFIMFFNHCKQPVMAVWDEDDYYEPDYLKKSIDKLLSNNHNCGVWNFTMKFCRRGSIRMEQYNSAYGTLVGRTDKIKRAALAFEKEHPNGMICEKAPGGKLTWRGPLDGPFRRYLVKMYSDNIVEHDAIRWYTFNENANTRHFGHRNPLESIDYKACDMPEIKLEDIAFVTLKSGQVITFGALNKTESEKVTE